MAPGTKQSRSPPIGAPTPRKSRWGLRKKSQFRRGSRKENRVRCRDTLIYSVCPNFCSPKQISRPGKFGEKFETSSSVNTGRKGWSAPDTARRVRLIAFCPGWTSREYPGPNDETVFPTAERFFPNPRSPPIDDPSFACNSEETSAHRAAVQIVGLGDENSIMAFLLIRTPSYERSWIFDWWNYSSSVSFVSIWLRFKLIGVVSL